MRRGDRERRAATEGRDIYAHSATLVCTAARHILEGRARAAGAHAAGAILDAGAVLAAIESAALVR